jgi:hypothetical protein
MDDVAEPSGARKIAKQILATRKRIAHTKR